MDKTDKIKTNCESVKSILTYKDIPFLVEEIEKLENENVKLKESTLDPVEMAKVANALEELKKRGEGCEYCLNQSEFGNFDILKKPWGYELRGYGSGSSETINYCPMCGRKL